MLILILAETGSRGEGKEVRLFILLLTSSPGDSNDNQLVDELKNG